MSIVGDITLREREPECELAVVGLSETRRATFALLDALCLRLKIMQLNRAEIAFHDSCFAQVTCLMTS